MLPIPAHIHNQATLKLRQIKNLSFKKYQPKDMLDRARKTYLQNDFCRMVKNCMSQNIELQ